MIESDKPPSYEYVLSGRSASGRQVTEIVEAPTADHAVRQFEGRGRTDVVLHTDDLVAPLNKPSELKPPFTLRQHVRAQKMGPFVVFWYAQSIVMPWVYCQFWWLVLLGLAWIAYRRVEGGAVDYRECVAAGMVVLPAVIALTIGIHAMLKSGRGIIRAVGWARWDEVLRRLRRVKEPKFDHRLFKAQALAGLGRISEALSEFDHVADMPNVPPYVYWYFQA